MKVHQRVLLVLLALLAIFLGVYFWDIQRHEEAAGRLFDSFVEAESQRLNTVLELDGRRLETFALDYSWWDEMVTHVQTPNPQWWAGAMRDIPRLYGADAAWALTQGLEVAGAVDHEGIVPQGSTAFFLPKFKEALARGAFGHFFVHESGTLWELRYAPIQPSTDRARLTAPRGYFVAGRRWDAALLVRMKEWTGAEFALADADRISKLPPVGGDRETGVLVLARPFGNANGLAVGGLVATKTSPLVPVDSDHAALRRRWPIIGLGGAGILSLFLCIIWVTRPLSMITQALERNDTALLQRVGRKSSEMGLIARLVESEAVQRNTLETEMRRRGDAELKLAQREHFLSTILRHLNGVVLVISRDGILNLAEGRELEAYGLRKERDEGRPIDRILRGQSRLEHFEAALAGKRMSEEQEVGDRTFLTTCEPLPAKDGSVELIVVLALDITEKKEAEAALMRAKQEAERADRLKSQFLSVMSHETRTPLNGVLGFASVLKETPLSEEQMGYLDRIVESAQNLLRLLTDILDLTRLEAGESKFSIEPISLTALIYQFAERYRLSAAKKGLGFDLDVDPKLPEYINNDSEKVSRILGSLLDNAVKFTDKGGIRLAVNRSRDLDGRWQVLFTVADTGPGIPKDLSRFMFDPFQQGDSSKTRRHGGLGLGLTIAHRMARKIEGRLTFESEPGKGSRFYLSLPLNENATATTTK